MPAKDQHPWASGPGEILRHGVSLLKTDNDVNRRLAMISIDNAVELMIKTYLGLPKRITGLAISRRDFAEISESFPALLDALEKLAADRLDGIELGTIEWYHRLRNQLYHQGNGLTVERDKVEVYAELANLLFKNLFGVELVKHITPETDLLGQFMSAWISLERAVVASPEARLMAAIHGKTSPGAPRPTDRFRNLAKDQRHEFVELRKIRNSVIHGQEDYRKLITPEVVARAQALRASIAKNG
jgi:hypothetical protein